LIWCTHFIYLFKRVSFKCLYRKPYGG